MPTSAVIATLEWECDSWFENKARGRGTKINIFADKHLVQMSIRHGSLFRREEVMSKNQITIAGFRPVDGDTVIYDRRLGELRINARYENEKFLYCRLLGKYIFGDDDCFPVGDKYSLEPLREYALESLFTFDIEGIDEVRLTKLCWYDDEDGIETTTRESPDVFHRLSIRREAIPEKVRLVSATLSVKYVDVRDWKSVTLRPPNVAIYTRSVYAANLELWFERRGFAKVSCVDGRRIDGQVLASVG